MFSNFNPRTHKECDLNHCNTLRRTCYFNPRTHKECDEIINPAYDWFNKFQSTHSQGVRLNGGSYLNVNVDISIHALTKSATGFVLAIECLMLISIHALTKSATDYRQTSSGDCMISIHALTKSATHFQSHCLTAKKYFNPRTHKECDSVKMLSYCLIPYFNPRTHKECDNLATL